ncbi:F0F1 ATP synthase subunit B [Candidatus Laterigemmans baculatus]|uniref:F0F1 ATP synthase subunit B n=1 Tax=Candidatus Laterigemmans baculatus TaxID=2770505 RepID=UPI001F2AFDA0|nr:F0F1 ATP synthase subunit B [Candidatus Laterigemmans baculatus]
MDFRTPFSCITLRRLLASLLMVLAVVISPAVCSAQATPGEVPAEAVDVEVHDEHLAHDEHAAHAEAPPLLNIDFGSAVWNLLIFLVVLAILGKFVWPQILAGLQARENKIHTDLQDAERANREAKQLLAQYQTQLDEAQVKVQEMLAEARRDAERTGARIVEEAKGDADRQRQRAVADIEAAKTVAITELADQTSELAIALARQVVGRELNPSDHAELIRQSLERIPSRN